MKHLRNLHDPIPTKMGYTQCRDWGATVAKRLGHKPGTSLEPMFERLEGKLERVYETFGRYDDIYVFDAKRAWTLTHLTMITLDIYQGSYNQVIAEGFGHLFLHYVMVKSAHGEDAAMAVSRYNSDEQEQRAKREAHTFMMGFLIHDDVVAPMFLEGMTDKEVASALGVTIDLVEKRRKAVMEPTLPMNLTPSTKRLLAAA